MIEITTDDKGKIVSFEHLEPEKYLLGIIPLHAISWKSEAEGSIGLDLVRLKKVDVDWIGAYDYYTPDYCYLIAKVMVWAREKVLWKFLRFCNWVGVIEKEPGDQFSWGRNFWRISPRVT